MSEVLFTVLIVVVVLERLVELVVSKRNAAWSFARGGIETGQRHYLVMVVLHSAFLVGMLVEVWVRQPQFEPALAYPMLVLVLACQGMRYWCIHALGRHWNTRVIVVPGARLVTTGPYRFLSHPNYVVVVIEGVALPLVGGAWITALVFTVCNAVLLTVRLRVERAALRSSVADPSVVAA